MKFFIASDIHGSSYYCKKVLEAFEVEKAHKLLLLGDILYHGPRNDLPKDYAPKEVIAMLNPMKQVIYCVRGNCDTEVDQMVLEFPILGDYCILPVGDKVVYASHGHKYNPDNLPPLGKGDILLNGHTHIPACEVHENFIYMNPGSTSIPKNGSHHGYMTLEDGVFLWKDFAGNVIQRYCL